MHRATCAALIATALLSACGGPVVRSAKNAPPAVSEDLAWLSYSLPLRLYTVRFERTYADTEQYRRHVAKTAAVTAAAALVSATDKALRAARAQELSDPGNAGYKGEVRKQEFLLAEYTRLLEAAEVDAIKARAQFDATKTFARNCGFDDRVSVTPARYVADPRARYYAVFDHRSWRNDQLKLSTTTSGLLTSGVGDVTDRSGEVAQGIVRVLSLPNAYADAGLARATEGVVIDTQRTHQFDLRIDKDTKTPLVPPNLDSLCNGTEPFVMEHEIDPASESDRIGYMAALRANGAYVILKTTQLGSHSTLESSENLIATCEAWPSNPSARASARACVGGLFHRRSRPAVLRWYGYSKDALAHYACPATPDCKASEYPEVWPPTIGDLRESFALELPNGNDVEFIAFATGALTRSTNNVTFDNGMLTAFDSTRPSELVAALALPVDIAKVPLSLVSDLLTLRIQTTSKQTDQLAAEIALRRQQVLAEEARAGYFGGTPPTRPIQPPAEANDD
jgi:hypothetical protein